MLSVPCPTCNRPVYWSDNSPWRPFCSERCKLADLGAWASEQHKIAGEPIPEDGGDDPEDARKNQ
jgi:hypothetical protein